MSEQLIPGPLPERADNYVTNDPEPWERFDGSRAAHTGVNLYGSGYQFKPRMSVDDSTLEELAAEFPYRLNETEPCATGFDENGNVNDPEKWTGNWTGSTTPEVAQELCAGCHVAEMCLAYALVNEERDHIWGGTTPDQRKELISARRQRTKARNDRPNADPKSPRQAT